MTAYKVFCEVCDGFDHVVFGEDVAEGIAWKHERDHSHSASYAPLDNPNAVPLHNTLRGEERRCEVWICVAAHRDGLTTPTHIPVYLDGVAP